jgi:hypothetical protein
MTAAGLETRAEILIAATEMDLARKRTSGGVPRTDTITPHLRKP